MNPLVLVNLGWRRLRSFSGAGGMAFDRIIDNRPNLLIRTGRLNQLSGLGVKDIVKPEFSHAIAIDGLEQILTGHFPGLSNSIPILAQFSTAEVYP